MFDIGYATSENILLMFYETPCDKALWYILYMYKVTLGI